MAVLTFSRVFGSPSLTSAWRRASFVSLDALLLVRDDLQLVEDVPRADGGDLRRRGVLAGDRLGARADLVRVDGLEPGLLDARGVRANRDGVRPDGVDARELELAVLGMRAAIRPGAEGPQLRRGDGLPILTTLQLVGEVGFMAWPSPWSCAAERRSPAGPAAPASPWMPVKASVSCRQLGLELFRGLGLQTGLHSVGYGLGLCGVRALLSEVQRTSRRRYRLASRARPSEQPRPCMPPPVRPLRRECRPP